MSGLRGHGISHSVAVVNLIERTREGVAAEVRAAMGRHRVTQSALAKQIGMSRPALSDRINGTKAFNTDDLAAICEVLDLDFLSLFSATDPQDGAA